jgi:hypothetical protein
MKPVSTEEPTRAGNSRRLTVLSPAERLALYGLPDFDDFQRAEFFAFTDAERTLAERRKGPVEHLHCLLQIGYFKAKNAFFNLSAQAVPPEDVAFLVQGRQPIGENALSNAERQARYRARREAEQPLPKIRYRRPVDRRTRAQRWCDTVAGLVALRPSMPPGTTHCPTACAIVLPPRRSRPLSILTSKSSRRSCHRAATGAIEPQQNQGRAR